MTGILDSVSQFEYSAWFRDESMPPDQQDHEWLAVFLIEAENEQLARSWGDQLARSFSARSGHEVFLSSAIRDTEGQYPQTVRLGKTLPLIRYGVEANDSEIGW